MGSLPLDIATKKALQANATLLGGGSQPELRLRQGLARRTKKILAILQPFRLFHGLFETTHGLPVPLF